MKKSLVILLIIFVFSLGFFNSVYASNTCVQGGGGSTSLCNPIGNFFTSPINRDNPVAIIMYIFNAFGGFFALTAIVMIVFSGFVMITANGNEEKITKGKDSLKWSVLGLALALLSYAIIAAIMNFTGATIPQGAGTTPSAQPINPFGDKNFYGLLLDMITGFLNVAGIIAVLMIIIGGFKYITAAGNDEQATQAKTTLQWAVIGVIVIILAYVITKATAAFFGSNII